MARISHAAASVYNTATAVSSKANDGTFTGVLVGVLLVILLYVSLQHTAGIAKILSSLTASVTWLVSPAVIPF